MTAAHAPAYQVTEISGCSYYETISSNHTRDMPLNAILLPENSGYWPGGSALQGYISNRTFKRSMAALCFGNGYFRGTPDKI